MNDNFSRIMNAAYGGKEEMEEYSAIWDTMVAISNKKDALDAKITEIEDLEDIITDGTGITGGKKTSKGAAATTGWKVAKAVTVFARDTGDEELEAEINFSWSQIRYAKDQDFIDILSLIYDRGHAHETALDTGGYIDIALIGVLLTQKNAFVTKSPKPKAKRSSNKAANQQVGVKIKELQVIKQDLLDLLVQFSDSDPLFYGAVKAAFEQDMTGVRLVAMRLRYEDSVTGVKLGGVVCSVLELGLSKESSKRGVVDFMRDEVVNGNYIVVSKLVNYIEDRQVNVGIEAGKMQSHDIKLVKGALIKGIVAGGASVNAPNLPPGTMVPPAESVVTGVCEDDNVALEGWFTSIGDLSGLPGNRVVSSFSKDHPLSSTAGDMGFSPEFPKLVIRNTSPDLLGHYSIKIIFA